MTLSGGKPRAGTRKRPGWTAVGARIRTAGVRVTALCVVAAGCTGAIGGTLDLKLDSPQSTARIEGRWTYQPFDGSAPYAITIGPSNGGFYELEGRRDGKSAPVLQLDRARDGALYRGQVTAGFDACVPAGARISIDALAATIVFEATYPVAAPFHQLPPGACRSAVTYVLVATGHGDSIKLRPASDLGIVPPAGAEVTAVPQDRYGTDRSVHSNDKAQAAPTITIGAPMVAGGSEVELLGSLQDAAGKFWHHVKAREADIAEKDEPDADGSTTAEDVEGESGHGSEAATGKDRGAKASEAARRRGPPSGYVPEQSVLARWVCRLEREASPPSAGAGKDGSERR